MIYECDQCGEALSAGIMACPSCKEKFDEPVPADAAATTASVELHEPPPFDVQPRQITHGPRRAQAIFGSCAVAAVIALIIASNQRPEPSHLVVPVSQTVISSYHAASVAISAHKQKAVPAAPHLSQGQINSGFDNLAYAQAYDKFGRSIMRRDHDVREVAESNRDSASDFYVAVRQDHISSSRATSRARRYLAAFVEMRRRYFGAEDAAKADLTLRAADDSTMASAGEDGAKPDCVFYDTCGQQDAADAAAPPTLDAAIARLQAKCGSGVTSDELLRVTSKAHDLMAARGVEEDPASIASHVADTIPAGYQPGEHVTDLFGAYIALRVGSN